MGGGGLSAVIKMGTGSTKVFGQERRSIGDRIIGEEIFQVTISRIGSLKVGLLIKLMKVFVKGSRAALTMKSGENFEVSQGLCIALTKVSVRMSKRLERMALIPKPSLKLNSSSKRPSMELVDMASRYLSLLVVGLVQADGWDTPGGRLTR